MPFQIRTNTDNTLVQEYVRKGDATRRFNDGTYELRTHHIYDTNWRNREMARSSKIDLTEFGLEPITDHFLHVSAKDKGEGPIAVSYTADDRKGGEDKQVSGRAIGRYLTEFYSSLGNDQITILGSRITSKIRQTELILLTSREDIRSAYEDSGIESCMQYKASHWSQSVHPTEAYHGPDLALAVIKNTAGRIVARAICWPERKVYGRVYGDYVKLREALNNAGFAEGSLIGARMSMIEARPARGGQEFFAMPYIDEGQYCYLHGTEDYFIIGRSSTGGAVQLSSGTNGYVQVPIFTCPVLGRQRGGVERVSVSHINNGTVMEVSARALKTHKDQFIVLKGATYYVPPGEKPVLLTLADGQEVPKGWFDQYGATCSVTGIMDVKENMVAVRANQFVTPAAYYTTFGVCQLTRRIYPRAEMLWMEHGAFWSRDAAKGKFQRIEGRNYANELVPATEAPAAVAAA